MAFFLLALTACDLLAEAVGAYTCDEYCNEVVAKTDECAQVAYEADCESNPGCAAYSDEELAAYAAEGREDWAGASKTDMLASCEADLSSAGKADTECQAETALINNLTCDEILQLLGDIQSGA